MALQVSLPTESIDVAPTILDLAGIEVPDTMDGRSLKSLLHGHKPDDWREFTMSEVDFGNPVAPTLWQQEYGLSSQYCHLAVIRNAQASLVHFGGGMPQILFDHSAGGEARNLADDPAYQTLRQHLSEALLSHRMAHAEGRFAKTMITEDGAVRGEF